MANENNKTDRHTAEVESVEAVAANDNSLQRNANLDNIVFALLFAADEPVSIRKMASIVEDAPGEDVKAAVERWRKRFDEEAWSVRIEQVAGGYQVSTRENFAPYIGRLYSGRRKFRLSRAGLETLAIVAYKQPITRAEVENLRGVGSGGVMTNLMERALIKITGKAKVLGAPFLYGTTSEFLEYLGLNSLSDLPSLEELENLLEKEAYPESAVAGLDDEDSSLLDDPVEAANEDPDTECDPGDFAEVVAALDLAKKAAGAAIGKKKEHGDAVSETDPTGPAGPAGAASAGATLEAMTEDDTMEGTAIPTIEFGSSKSDGEPDDPGDDDERNG